MVLKNDNARKKILREFPLFARLSAELLAELVSGSHSATFHRGQTIVRSGGMEIGGVTPFGLPPDLPVWIDAAVMERSRIIVGGGSRDRKILCPPSSLLSIAGAEVVDGLAVSRRPATD